MGHDAWHSSAPPKSRATTSSPRKFAAAWSSKLATAFAVRSTPVVAHHRAVAQTQCGQTSVLKNLHVSIVGRPANIHTR